MLHILSSLVLLVYPCLGEEKLPNAPSEGQFCQDVPGWKDRNNYTCNDYYVMGWCEDWWYGTSWKKDWGFFANYVVPPTAPADQACCKCGLTWKSISAAIDCVQQDWEESAACLSVGEGVCQRTLRRPLVTMPLGGGRPCKQLTKQVNCTGCPQCILTEWSNPTCHVSGLALSTRSLISNDASARCGELGKLQKEICPASMPMEEGYVLQMAGDNSNGQLGHPDIQRVDGLTAIQVRLSGFALPVTNVMLGPFHSAVLASRLMFTTGSNGFGQLGLGDTQDRSTFQMVLFPRSAEILQFALGHVHSLVLLKNASSTVLYGFGDTYYGQLGVDPEAQHQNVVIFPQMIDTSGYRHGSSNGAQLSDEIVISSVAAGGHQSAFISSVGEVYIFGAIIPENGKGRSTIVKLEIEERVRSISLGYRFSAFLTTSGSLYVASYPYFMKDGTQTELSLLTTGVQQVAAGDFHCVVLMDTGEVKAWGETTYRQLGIGVQGNEGLGLQNVTFPVGSTATQVAAGVRTSAAIISGLLYTWGAKNYGQFGANTSVPQLARSMDYTGSVERVSIGEMHIAVLRGKTGTPTLTQSSVPSSTSSKTFTPATTLSATLSATQSTTSSVTQSDPSTLTPSFVSCGGGNHSLANGPWTLAAQMRCTQILLLGPGTTAITDRHVVLRITSLPTPLKVSILEGCQGTLDECEMMFTQQNSGDKVVILLGAAEEAVMQLLYGSDMEYQFRALSEPAQVEVFTEHKASFLFLVYLCVACAVVATILVSSGMCLLSWWISNHQAAPWLFNERLARLPLWVMLGIGLWSVLNGVGWCVVAVVTSSPEPEPLMLLIVGGILAGLGSLLALGCWLWTQYDSEQQMCVACGHPVSRWRFTGTYVPQKDNPLRCAKAHTSHIACVSCNKLVIMDGWAEAPPHRPYHATCWDARCIAAVADPKFVSRWMATQQPGDITDTELVHLLATAVKHSAKESIQEILSINRTLVNHPVAQDGNRSVMHIAARTGKLPILTLLVNAGPQCLDPVCATDPRMPSSLSITGLEEGEGNDIYIHQPFLSFNQRPVYIGHAHGKYLYYYDPAEDDSQERNPAGWCLSSVLGSGTSPWRIPLVDHIGMATQQDTSQQQKCQQSRCSVPQLNEHLSMDCGASLKRKMENLASIDGALADRIDCPAPSPSLSLVACESPNALSLDAKMQVGFPPGINVMKLPHTISLLEEAVVSSDTRTIQYVKKLYVVQDPSCLVWKYYTCHGLWDLFPASAQAKIRAAMSEGRSTIALSEEQFTLRPGNVDLSALHIHFADSSSPINCTFRATFQTCKSDEHSFWFTCDETTVVNCKDSVVVVSPGHVAAAAPSEETLAFLVAQGLTEHAAWKPPSQLSGPSPILDDLWQGMFISVLQNEISQVMGLTGGMISVAKEVARWGQQQERPSRSETGIGHRLTDGLEQNQSSDQVAFYAPNYRSDYGTLPFCSLLPNNPVGMKFILPPIVLMGADALMKLHEMQRQGTEVTARHIIALYVYSYELAYPEQGYDQIYAEMNKAMRLRLKEKIEFWRPLIWEIDVALNALPSYKGKAYRGINVQMDPTQYEVNNMVCWPSFSSASQSQAVAEEFAKGQAGTLFFLTSVSAKPISAISRFPGEAEVLFPSNSMFQVTSTLFGSSEIGSFYVNVDNVAMSETTGQIGSVANLSMVPRCRVAGHTPFLLQVPSEISNRVLDILAGAGITVFQSAWMEEAEDGLAGELVVVNDE